MQQYQNKLVNIHKQINVEYSSQILLEYGLYLKKMFPSIKIFVNKNNIFIHATIFKLQNIALFLKNHTNSQYKSIIDICAIDYPEKKNRFEILYHFLSVRYNSRLNISIIIQDSVPVPSLTNLYKGADWMEREVWDLFGIFFSGHKDLRRILTDYGFKGHPLRKDFPLSGFIETIYNDFYKKLDYQEISLAQAYRNFNLSSFN